VVGQVSNPSATSSQQYGYLSLINGLSAEQIFTTATPSGQNETTALFKFFADAVTDRVILNGGLRIINRTGTTIIYYDDSPDGDFADRDTFRNGTPIVTIDYRQLQFVSRPPRPRRVSCRFSDRRPGVQLTSSIGGLLVLPDHTDLAQPNVGRFNCSLTFHLAYNNF
jgi:hypothetical protein